MAKKKPKTLDDLLMATGESYNELAARAGIARFTLFRLRSGLVKPRRKTLHALAGMAPDKATDSPCLLELDALLALCLLVAALPVDQLERGPCRRVVANEHFTQCGLAQDALDTVPD